MIFNVQGNSRYEECRKVQRKVLSMDKHKLKEADAVKHKNGIYGNRN